MTVVVDRIFEECYDCGEPLVHALDDEFPLCDDCVIRRGPESRWCCAHIGPFDFNEACPWNEAFWGRWEAVWARRALAA